MQDAPVLIQYLRLIETNIHISLYIHRTVAKLANTQEVSNTNNAKL